MTFDRNAGIGASEAAMALGISKFGPRFDLYARKRGLTADLVVTPVMEWGHLLEPVIIKRWAQDHGSPRILGRARAAHDAEPYLHPEHPWMYAHYDGLCPSLGAIIEAKSGWSWSASEWGEPGSDEVPQDYWCQAQHQLAIAPARYTRVIIPALIGRPPLKEYVVPRDEAFIREVLIPGEQELWERVLRGEPPEIEAGEGAEAYLRTQFPSASEEVLEATEDDTVLAMAYLSARAQRDAAMAQMDEAAVKLKDRLGNAAHLVGPGVKVSWVNVAPSAYIDTSAMVDAYPEIAKQFTKSRGGTRRINVRATD